MMRDTHSIEHLGQQSRLFPIDFVPARSASFPRSSRAIEYKDWVDVESEKSAYPPVDGLFDRIGFWGFCEE